MQIKPMIYENLTAPQRVIAVIEAEARDDEAEVQRLVKSCPKKTYRMNDAAFVETIQSLTHITLHVECMIHRKLLGVVAAFYLERDESIDRLLQSIADIRGAWERMLESMGIAPDAMRKALVLGSSCLEVFEELMPEPDSEQVAALMAGMKTGFD